MDPSSLSYMCPFLVGVFLTFVLELILLVYMIKPKIKNTSSEGPLSFHNINGEYEGVMWIASISNSALEKAENEANISAQKRLKEQKNKKEVIKFGPAVSPTWTYAKLQKMILNLRSMDGDEDQIFLLGCDVVAISGSDTPSKKWAKKYPIKLQHNSRMLYGGSNICLLYLDTGWEKEVWCGILRAASKGDVNNEQGFGEYISSLKKKFPSLLEMDGPPNSIEGKYQYQKQDPLPARKRLWKKLMKSSKENKSKDEYSKSDAVSSHRRQSQDDMMIGLKSSIHTWLNNGPRNESDLVHNETLEKSPSNEDSSKQVCDIALHSWNIFFSRIFFDIIHSSAVISYLENRIKKKLSKLSTPSYIGPITCTGLDLGEAPPLVQRMRVLSMDLNGVWILEADVSYAGGVVLTFETRLEVQDPDPQEKDVSHSEVLFTEGSMQADANNKTEELQYASNQIAVPDALKEHEQRVSKDGEGSSKNKRWSSRLGLKAMISHVANRMSQVPFTLSIRIVSLEGTLQVRIKTPPTDRIWFGFSSMPDIELHSIPSIADRKLRTGPVVGLITDRIKVLLRDSLVYPNLEDIHIPWMMAEDGDWLSQTLVPFPWSISTRESQSSSNVVSDSVESSLQSEENIPRVKPLRHTSSFNLQRQPLEALSIKSEDLSTSDQKDSFEQGSLSPLNSPRLYSKKESTREKVLSLGKKVSGRLEEKTRSIAGKLRDRLEGQSENSNT